MKKLGKILKKSKRKVVNYVSTNRLFLSYVIFSIISTILIRNFTIKNIFEFSPLFIDIGVILVIGALGYLIKPKNQFKYYFTWIIIYTIICVVNSIYYNFYLSFASVSLLSTAGQLGDVSDALVEQLRLIDFIYVIFPILFFIIHKLLKKSTYYSYVAKVEKSKKMCVSTILVGVVVTACALVTVSASDYGGLVKQWNPEFIVKKFGILVYQGNDLCQSLTPKINSLFGYDEAARKFREFYQENKAEASNNQYTNIFKGKNIVFIHMESMQGVLLDMEFNGKKVLPNVTKLANEGMYFSNFYPQVSVGTSSDTEFSLSSSLFPALSGTVAVNYYDRDYVTIQKLFKEIGYYTFSMHANKASMWNRDDFHKSFGYEKFYSITDFTDYPLPKTDEEKELDPEWVGLGLSDHEFFKQLIPKLELIEQENKNYFGTLITLSNHTPFDSVEKYDEFDLSYTGYRINAETGLQELVTDSYLNERKLGNYIKSAHYADRCLGELIDYIKNSDYFNDTIFVFYGDHDARLNSKEFNYYYNYDLTTGTLREEGDEGYVNFDTFAQELNRKTPLIIWTKDEKLRKKINTEVTDVMGMVDVLPTIGNMFGVENPYALGHDIFTIKDDNVVVFPNGNFLTNKVYYDYSTSSYQTLYQGATITNEYINYYVNYAEERLEISNSIIVYDLIKKEKEENRGLENESTVQS